MKFTDQEKKVRTRLLAMLDEQVFGPLSVERKKSSPETFRWGGDDHDWNYLCSFGARWRSSFSHQSGFAGWEVGVQRVDGRVRARRFTLWTPGEVFDEKKISKLLSKLREHVKTVLAAQERVKHEEAQRKSREAAGRKLAAEVRQIVKPFPESCEIYGDDDGTAHFNVEVSFSTIEELREELRKLEPVIQKVVCP